MAKIDTVEARSKLKAKNEPYWQRLSKGCSLGYRKLTPSSTGTWVALYTDPDTKDRTKKSLGDFEALPASQRYDAAKKGAEAMFTQLGKVGAQEALTVEGACKRYVEHKQVHTTATYIRELEARFTRWVYSSKIAKIELNKLRRNDLDKWLAEMIKTPVVANPHSTSPVTRERSKASVNRDMAELRAALNFARDNQWVADDSSWNVALRSLKNASKRRDVYLDKEQRRSLIKAMPKDAANYIHGLTLLPLRPGALAELTVRQFDPKLGVITIHIDKHGQDRRIKLPLSTASLFREWCANKGPHEPIFTQENGQKWVRHAWKKPFAKAIEVIGLPEDSVTYSLRHSAITDLANGGLDLLSIALISGTSIAMIQKHYGHLKQDHATEALAGLSIDS